MVNTMQSRHAVVLQHHNNLDSINQDIYDRKFPSSDMQMNFSPRPVSTKYARMPILDHRREATVAVNNHSTYNSEETFFPGNSKPHYCGFASSVDKESTLRNQFFALQKSDQAAWMPSSTSDLYVNNVVENNNINDLNNVNNSALFREEQFADFNPNISNHIGNNVFNNATRVQLKNI